MHLRNLFGFFVSRNAQAVGCLLGRSLMELGPVGPHKAAEISIIGIYRRGELLWCMAERTKVAESISLSVSLSLSLALSISLSLSRLYLFVSLSICFFEGGCCYGCDFVSKICKKKLCSSAFSVLHEAGKVVKHIFWHLSCLIWTF